MSTNQLDRRSFLRATGLLAGTGLAAASVGTLTGCTGGSDTKNAKITGGAVTLPTYKQLEAVKPDLPPIQPTGTSGYLTYPTSLIPAVTAPVMTSGKPLSILAAISSAPYVPRESNPILQAVEERIGGQLDFTQITESDYLQRLSTTVAGGDLPDVLYFPKIAGYANLLQSKFADLTPFLAGDAILEYPGLANLPSALWQACAVGDKIYGLPQPRNGMSGYGLYHQEMVEAAGGYPKTAAEFLALLTELTRPQDKRWGMVANQGTAYNLATFLQIFGAPFNWRLDGSSLTPAIETEQYKAALEFASKVYAAGVFHPNTNGPAQQMSTLFHNGQAAFSGMSITGLPESITIQATINKAFKPAALTPFSHDGQADPVVFMDFVTKDFTAVVKADDERIKEILRVANFLASPLGTEEFQLFRFGVEGQTFEMKDGAPFLLNPDVRAGAPWGMFTAPPFTLFAPANPTSVPAVYDVTKAMSPSLIKDPTEAAYSETDARVGATLAQRVNDACTSIIAGRKPLSSFDESIKQWKSGGGDKIKAELEAALGQS